MSSGPHDEARQPIPLAADEFAFLKDLHNRLTDAPLEPDDPYYQPLHEGLDDPVERMATVVPRHSVIRHAPVDSMQLFSGFRRSGKTTELFCLRRMLLEDPSYVVLYANALDYLNPAEPLDITDLLMVLAAGFGESMAGIPGAPSMQVGIFERVKDFLINTEARVTSAGVKAEVTTPLQHVAGGLKAGVDLKLELKSPSSFRRNLRKVLNSELTVLQQQLIDFYADAVRRIRLAKGAGTTIVFLFDQLEQLRGSRFTEKDMIRSIVHIFTLHIDRLKIPNVHVVYAVPPWLKFAVRGLETVILPSVHLWERDADRSPTQANLATFHALVRRRLGDDGIRRLFGADPARQNALIGPLVEMSNGHVRDLLCLLRNVLIDAPRGSLPVEPATVNGAINRVRREFMSISLDDARRLAEIAETRSDSLKNTESENIDWLNRALDDHSVLYFVNDHDWFDIHRLIREEVARLAPPESDPDP